jgi:hypothetical protein
MRPDFSGLTPVLSMVSDDPFLLSPELEDRWVNAPRELTRMLSMVTLSFSHLSPRIGGGMRRGLSGQTLVLSYGDPFLLSPEPEDRCSG